MLLLLHNVANCTYRAFFECKVSKLILANSPVELSEYKTDSEYIKIFKNHTPLLMTLLRLTTNPD